MKFHVSLNMPRESGAAAEDHCPEMNILSHSSTSGRIITMRWSKTDKNSTLIFHRNDFLFLNEIPTL
jgi:hypothetical protein